MKAYYDAIFSLHVAMSPTLITLAHVVEGTVLGVCVCVSVCVLPQNCYKLQLSQNLNKLQVTNLVI